MSAIRLACVVFLAFLPHAAGARECQDSIADAAARAVVRAIDQCPEKFYESADSYYAYAQQAVVGLLVPGASEAAGLLVLDQAREDAFFCITDALIAESGASAADKAFLTSLVAEAKEVSDRKELAGNVANIGKAFRERGIGAYFQGDVNTFVNTLDVELGDRKEGLKLEGQLADAGRARYDTLETRARNQTEAARALGRDCRFEQAAAGLATAQQANRAYLAHLRAEVEDAKHHLFCLERNANQRPINEFNPAPAFVTNSIESARRDFAAAEARAADQAALIGQLAELEQSFRARRNDLEALKQRAARHLETARQAGGNCRWAEAAAALDQVNVETIDCALELDAQRREREEVEELIEQAKQQPAILEAEYAKVIGIPFAQFNSCGELSVFADAINQFVGECRVLIGGDAKVAALRQRARECADERLAGKLSGALVGKADVTPEKFEDFGARGFRRSTYGARRHVFEHNDKVDNRRVVIAWNYDGVPATLAPGQPVTIKVTGGVESETPQGAGDGFVLSGAVAVYGNVTMVEQRAADRGNPVGIYQFTVNPGATEVEIHLGGYPMGTGAIWKYSKSR